MMKNGILTFIFAFCPGAGQMYQGYMKRGLSLITMFCLFVVIGVSTLQVLTIGCAIVWMYSFFDTFNLRAQIGAGTAPEDDYLVHINWKNQRMQEFMMDSHKLLGWGLIVLGALVAYQNILMNTLGDIVWRWGQSSPFFRALYLMMDQLPEIVVCVAPRAESRSRRPRTPILPSMLHRKHRPGRRKRALQCPSSRPCWASL